MQIVSNGDNLAWNVKSFFFSGKIRKHINNLSSAELAQSVVEGTKQSFFHLLQMYAKTLLIKTSQLKFSSAWNEHI